MDRLVAVNPFLVSFVSTLHNGRDDNSRGNSSKSCAAKPLIFSRLPRIIGNAIRSLYHGARNQTLQRSHRKQTPDIGVNFDASSTAEIATGDFGWFRTVIDLGEFLCRIGSSTPKVIMRLSCARTG
jgi:hypothetical protein